MNKAEIVSPRGSRAIDAEPGEVVYLQFDERIEYPSTRKVFVVWDAGGIDEGGGTIYGIYSTREVAELVESSLQSPYRIEVEEFVLDELPVWMVNPLKPREPVVERPRTELEKLLANVCNRYLVAAYLEVG